MPQLGQAFYREIDFIVDLIYQRLVRRELEEPAPVSSQGRVFTIPENAAGIAAAPAEHGFNRDPREELEADAVRGALYGNGDAQMNPGRHELESD
jgi:hypothetical protein